MSDTNEARSDADTIVVDLGPSTHLRDGDTEAHKAGIFDVMLCRAGGKLWALEDLCSHADTTLSDGMLTGYAISCPLHGAQFDVRDGHHMSPPAYCGVLAFSVDEVDGRAVVVVPTTRPKGDGGAMPGYFQTR
jgi:nitrite reductase/ring-hydroxylating ferredoxin subunit